MNILIAEAIAQKPKQITRFCKIEITENHKLEAVFLAQYKHNKAEEKRKADEEEERRKQEAEE